MFNATCRNAGLPIARTLKSDGDHEIVTPELRRILAERKRTLARASLNKVKEG